MFVSNRRLTDGRRFGQFGGGVAAATVEIQDGCPGGPGAEELGKRRGGRVIAPSISRDPVLRALMAGALLATAWVFAGPWPDAASWLVQAALDGVFIWF